MRCAVFLLMCMLPIVCQGQGDIQMMSNMFRDGDVLVKKQLSYKDLSVSGKSVLWDISDVDIISEGNKAKIRDVSDSTARVAYTENGTIYYYKLCRDTLFIDGFENNSTKICYDDKEVFLRFPMSYGDSYSGFFHGTGTYCDKVAVRSFGRYSVKADACGAIVVPGGDTLRNVTRIHTERFLAGSSYPSDSIMAISSTPLGEDSIKRWLDKKPYLLKTDIYRWYAAGYRYPVLEIHLTYVYGSEHKPYAQVFYLPPSVQEGMGDDAGYSYARHFAPDDETNGDTRNKLVDYEIYLQGNSSVTVEYRLDGQSEVSYGISTHDGKLVFASGKRQVPAGAYVENIDMSGCRRGIYIVYVDVDGCRYTQTISLK